MTLIKNGTIIDGTGSKGFVGDVLVEGDRIVAVERGETKAVADETIDATGLLVTPGFIDAHSHSDAYLVLEPDAPSKLSQGITTELNGQCGGSIAPRYGEARLSSDWATLLGEKLVWRSLAEYREVLAQTKIAINTVEFIGHNTLRSSVMGYAARAASPDEVKSMARLLEAALDEGGYGFTTGLIYQPGKYSTNEEVLALARVAAQKGGFYATHMRSEGDEIEKAIDEVISLVKATGIRAEISHLKTSGEKNWPKIDAVLEKIEHAIADGLLLGSDRYPYCAAGTDLDVVLPDWAQEGAAKGELARLKDPALRSRIVRELNASDTDWPKVMIGGGWSEETRGYSGKTIASLAGNSPGEFIARVLELDGCKTGAFFFTMSEENLDKIYSREWILPGSDASLRSPTGPLGLDHPHPRAYGTMCEFYRRLRALGFSREQVVRRMTSSVAERFELNARGRIAKGFQADLVVWREDEFTSPATYSKPHAFALGVKAVLVNGAIAYSNGKFTGHRQGRFLER